MRGEALIVPTRKSPACSQSESWSATLERERMEGSNLSWKTTCRQKAVGWPSVIQRVRETVKGHRMLFLSGIRIYGKGTAIGQSAVPAHEANFCYPDVVVWLLFSFPRETCSVPARTEGQWSGGLVGSAALFVQGHLKMGSSGSEGALSPGWLVGWRSGALLWLSMRLPFASVHSEERASHRSKKTLCQLVVYLRLNQPSVILTGGFGIRRLTNSPGGHQKLSKVSLCSLGYLQALEQTHPLCSFALRVPLLPADDRQPSQHSERVPAPRINSLSHLERRMTAANPSSES